ncbi:ABC transporter permease [Roseomonas fluvialis]|uniref:ABC di/oligopeptide transporter inner membrane subunit n=1 Tax=Roseomonas fluvialis TaxID=1750527 RepID=A0ABN6NX91_9PROT|nr:ABC transporter permease [Roseomonas fluvialis]BDG71039.1 ABC di/oligopeptide transporter inner membrane subunit [Roseomonas fluvialis]
MFGVLVRRLFSALPVLLIVSLISFGLMRLIPGDPAAAIAGIAATPAQIEQLRRDLGLDEPLWMQLVHYYEGLARGDLGRSLLLGKGVFAATMERLPVTIALSLYALVFTLIIGIASGIIAALKQNTWIDQAAMMFAMIGISVPNFFLGLLMIILFAVHLGWLPSGGYVPFSESPIGWLRSMTMPAFSLALLQAGLLARITRSSMLEVLRQDYIRTAKAKGLPQRRVILKHALANALIPIVTVVGIIVSLLLSGAVVTEALFSIPGMGQLLTQAVLNRDYPMVQGGLLLVTTFLVLVNITVDTLYAVLDPRVRHE